MVYCGKASQGCQNCRTRRIKCNKVRPQCSQCIRVGKKCPGYRDQLSLMFRDESSKVIQKAHAQWGIGEGPESSQATSSSKANVSYASSSSSSSSLSSSSSSSSSSSYSSSVASASPRSVVRHCPWPLSPSSPSPALSVTSSNSFSMELTMPSRLCASMDMNLDERGRDFYLTQYIIGHPDEPMLPKDLASFAYIWDPALQDIMVAIGLAGLSNLSGNKSLMISARQSYGQALRQTGRLVGASKMPCFEVVTRSVILLALFELVKGTRQGIESVAAHVLGAAAVLRSWCPMPNAVSGGARALVQLCFTMFIPSHIAAIPIPAHFFAFVRFASQLFEDIDRPSIALGIEISKFLEAWSYVKPRVFLDGEPETLAALQRLVDVNTDLVAWEQSLSGIWCFRRETSTVLPPEAVFLGEYHIYHDLFIARNWNHYRWARILLNEAILDFATQYPVTGMALASAVDADYRLSVIQGLALDTLAGTPAHWRHPLLSEKTAISIKNPGGAGSGAAGVPVVLFHLKVAACARGVPGDYWSWAYGIMQCMWSDLGMLHAKTMMEEMTAHRDGLCGSPTNGIPIDVDIDDLG